MIRMSYILLVASLSFGQGHTTLLTDLNTPKEVFERMKENNLADSYAIDTRINPFYLRGDFNGDDCLDYAVMVRHAQSNKKGILIFHGGTSKVIVLGAGMPFPITGYAPDDFEPLDYWRVLRKKEMGVELQHGEGILIGISEAMSVVIYKKGNKYSFDRLED